MKKALVFGAGGQAGSYLVEYLKSLSDYTVLALDHRACDISKSDFLTGIPNVKLFINQFKPDEVYNLASRMGVDDSWDNAYEHGLVNGLSVVKILEALYPDFPNARFFNAGSASVFRQSIYSLEEWSPRGPANPYGVSKLFAEDMVRLYRELGFYACTGILFNMESERRSSTCFTRKVIRGAIRLRRELDEGKNPQPLSLGDLAPCRDWGYTPEYVVAMHLMLQNDKPKDYVIGTGARYSMEDFVHYTFSQAKVPINYANCTCDDSKFDVIWSYPRLIMNELGWEAKSTMPDIIDHMLEVEMKTQYGESSITR